jgi:hypothetical protein
MRLVIPISLLLSSVSLVEARAGELDDARQLAVQGRHTEAREAAHRALQDRPNDPEALQIIVVASCELGDRRSALWALTRLAPDVQSAAARHCARRGIVFDKVTARVSTGASTVPAVQAPDPRRPWRVGSWIALATTATSLITWVALAINVNHVEQDKEELILARRRETHDIYGSDDVCSEAEALGDQGMIDICRSGRRSSVAANLMLGVGLATAVLGGYLYYRGYVKREHPAARISVGPGSAALSVSF